MRHLRDVLISWGPLGILLLATIESAGIPNPGGTDALLLVLAIARPQEAMLCAALAAAGSLIGSVIFYEITRRGGEKFLAKYATGGNTQKFREWFGRYGLITVFIPALLPIPILPFKVFAACAGVMSVPRHRLLIVLAAARIPRYAALAYLGRELGENSTDWLRSHLWQMVALAAVIGIALYALVRWVDGRRTVGTV
ncbi:MAG TPA: VTT domain-containing protein [Bryobacteraceae bacterium]|nr:VTT domain-containing protein [Bryobacteraceae bacterium]